LKCSSTKSRMYARLNPMAKSDENPASDRSSRAFRGVMPAATAASIPRTTSIVAAARCAPLVQASNRGVAVHKVDPFKNANFETSFSLYIGFKGLKPGAFQLWVNWIELVHSPT
jgi:hypothetical protein